MSISEWLSIEHCVLCFVSLCAARRRLLGMHSGVSARLGESSALSLACASSSVRLLACGVWCEGDCIVVGVCEVE